MEKIDKKVQQYIMKGNSVVLTLIDKLNELVMAYNREIKKNKVLWEEITELYDWMTEMKKEKEKVNSLDIVKKE